MKLKPSELDYVRSLGLYITEKCDGCGKPLNQALLYTITGRREVYCSAPCRDTAFFGDWHEAKKRATPGKCAYCGGSLKRKKRGALYCDDACRKRASRTGTGKRAAEVEKSRTPTQLNQGLADAKNADQGNRITDASQRPRNVLGGIADKLGSPVEGSRSS